MASDLEEILQKFVPKRLYDELRRDYDRLLVRLGRMEEQLLMLSEYRLEPEEPTEVIDRKIRRAERRGRARARDLTRDRDEEEREPERGHEREEHEEREERREREPEPGHDTEPRRAEPRREREPEPRPRREREGERGGERERPRPWPRESRRRAEPETDLDESLAEESTDELIRRLRMRYREISRLRDRLREEEE